MIDVVVVGGGPAGLSAGLTLARARRSVVVVDSGEPRNAPAAGVHGFLGHDGIPPTQLIKLGRAEVEGYGGGVVDAVVTAVRARADGFEVDLGTGERLDARRLVVTTGLVDELPDVPGLRQRFGRDVLHCPYCHGWEVRDQPIAVLGSGAWSARKALLLRQWSADVVLVQHDAPAPTSEEEELLAARGVEVVRRRVSRLVVEDDALVGLELDDGTVLPRRALVVAPRFVARSALLEQLGLPVAEHPMGVGTYVPSVDPTGRTEVPGVWVAGNVADMMAQVITSAAAGVSAAAAVNMDLVEEDARLALAARP